MPGKPRHRYKGVLATPWNVDDGPIAVAERFTALFEHYNIDHQQPGAEIRLIFAMASRHVPGFATIPNSLRLKGETICGAGQKPTFTPAESITAYVDVRKLMDEGWKESEACRELVETPRWEAYFEGKKLQPKQKAERIRAMYRLYRDAFQNFLKGQATDTQLMALAVVYDVPFNDLEALQRQISKAMKHGHD